jgi:hypothetical protein
MLLIMTTSVEYEQDKLALRQAKEKRFEAFSLHLVAE